MSDARPEDLPEPDEVNLAACAPDEFSGQQDAHCCPDRRLYDLGGKIGDWTSGERVRTALRPLRRPDRA